MIVTYKTKELWEEAEKNGQNERFKREYFEFIKKYDRFGFITMDKHLIAVFDYPEIALSGRDSFDRFLEFIQEE